MNQLQRNKKSRERIKHQIRKKVNGTSEKPRLVVYRSANHIYVQFVDDANAKTLMTVASNSKDIAGKISSGKGKIEKSKLLGKLAAEKAAGSNITEVIFDRNGYLYHGRVKALADGAREGGLKF